MPDILTSLHGKELGLDKDRDLVLPSPAAFKDNVTAATSASTGTDIPRAGATTLSSAAAVWRLAAPTAGVKKTLHSISTSTANRAVALAAGNFISTAGSSFTTMVLQGLAYGADLLGLSTALYLVQQSRSAIFSTSTST